jgi:3-deoxy-D-arabino-heptulosonate 7-phosphate (DAHP) synthase
MRQEIINVLKQHFESHILKHKMNVDIMLANPMAIHDHTDLMDAIEKEVAQIAEYQDKLEIMNVYFSE